MVGGDSGGGRCRGDSRAVVVERGGDGRIGCVEGGRRRQGCGGGGDGLMYAESLDISTVKLAAIGGPHPPHKFVVSACTYDVVMVVRARDMISNTKYGKLQARAPIEHLVGKFASGMTNLLGKLAEDSVALAGSDGDAVVRQFTSFVGEHIHHPTSYRGWNDYNCSQELRDT
ncbi:hypothetical protein D1007_47631 [Hordeum vulgare]|nr:hypothetical protein D1007_47631 [Hordeum vulgare]